MWIEHFYDFVKDSWTGFDNPSMCYVLDHQASDWWHFLLANGLHLHSASKTIDRFFWSLGRSALDHRGRSHSLHTDWILTGLCARKLLRLFNKRRKSGTRPHFAKIPPMLESHLGSKVLLGPQFALSKQDFWSFYDHKVLVAQGNIDSGAYLDGWCRFGILLHKAVIHAILQDSGTSHSGHLNISGQVFFWFPECQKAFNRLLVFAHILYYFIIFYHIYSMVMHFHEETCLLLDCTKTGRFKVSWPKRSSFRRPKTL